MEPESFDSLNQSIDNDYDQSRVASTPSFISNSRFYGNTCDIYINLPARCMHNISLASQTVANSLARETSIISHGKAGCPGDCYC